VDHCYLALSLLLLLVLLLLLLLPAGVSLHANPAALLQAQGVWLANRSRLLGASWVLGIVGSSWAVAAAAAVLCCCLLARSSAGRLGSCNKAKQQQQQQQQQQARACHAKALRIHMKLSTVPEACHNTTEVKRSLITEHAYSSM
jgi:hypothetical protein